MRLSPHAGWRRLAGSAPPGRPRGRAGLPEGGGFCGAWRWKAGGGGARAQGAGGEGRRILATLFYISRKYRIQSGI